MRQATMRRATMRRATVLAAGLAALTATAMPLAAQATGRSTAANEFLATFGQVETKFYQLAEAIPFEKYAWRPGPGVRSVCEVFMHVTVDNYLLGKPLGVAMPRETEGPTAEQCRASKAAVVAAMKASFAAINAAAAAMPAADGDAPYTLFGTTMSKRAWLLATAEHAGEHLGQQIAYARMNGIVPPWSK